MSKNSKNTKLPSVPEDKWTIDTANPAELVTSAITVLAVSPVNFDALYGFLRMYFESTEYVTLEGLKGAIHEGVRIGREYDSNVVYDSDIFN